MSNVILKSRIIEKFGTQADFGQVVSVKEPIISRVIKGRKELTDSEKERWATALDSCVADLFSGTTKIPV